MKKAISLILALTFVFCFAGCSSNNLTKDIDEATKIEIVKYDISDGEEIITATITDGVNINCIIDNFKSLKLKKMENTEPTVLEYKLTFYNTDGEVLEVISVPVNDWIGVDGYFYSVAGSELDRAYISRFFNPIEYNGKYADDTDLLIISSEADIIADKILSHYENGGIILSAYWAYTEQIQEILSPSVTTSFSASDAAVLFYQTASTAPASSTIAGNSSDLDAEIDEMIEDAKEKQ